MTERDFKVKKGLTVENGDLEFKAASSVKLKDNSGTALVIKEDSTAYLTFDTSNTAEKITLGKKLEAGSVEIEGSAFDINGGAIDNTVIGAGTAAGAKFTTIETTQQVKINGTARETNSQLQVNGGSDYVEARLFTDIQNDQIDSTTVAKLGNMLVLDNEEDVPGTGQGVMFTVGAHDGNGDQFGIGRVIQGASSNPLFGIGFSDNAFDKSTASTAALLPTKLMLKFDSSGNATLEKNGAYLAFTGQTSGAADREIRFAASSNAISTNNTGSQTYILPTDFPTSSSKILQSTTSGALSWVSQGGGTADSVDATNINNASGAVNLVSTDGDVLVEAQAADHKVTIKGDHESDVAIHLDGDAAAASIVDIDAGVLDIDASGSINIATTGAAGDIAIVSAHTSGVAFHLDANAHAASEVQIDAGILDVDVTGAATIDSGGAMTLTGAGVNLAGGSSEIDITTTGALDINSGATTIDVGSSVSPKTLSIDSTDTTNITLTANDNSSDKSLTIEASNSGSAAGRVNILADGQINIGTATSGVPVTIGHGTSEVTFGDNVTITGNLTVNGDQTVINTTAIVAEDKSMLLGIAGGMEDATFARSSSTVTVTSASHGFANGESIFVSNMGNSITDGVYTVSSVSTNTFVLDSHGTSGTVGAGATMQHSSANTTEATADGSGIFVPGTSLHSIQYDSSNGFQVTDDLDLANGKHLSINGTTVLNATTLGSSVVSSSLTSVGTLTTLTVDNVLINGSNIGHTGDTDLITVASGIVTVAGEISVTTLDIGGTDVSSNAGELNLVDGSSAGSIVNSKAVIYSSAGQVNGTTLGVNSVSVMEVNSNDNAGSSSGAAITVFSMDKTVYRAAKIVLSVELLTTGAAAASKYEMMEILVHYDGSNSHHTTYGYMSTNATDLATITTSVSGDNVLVKYDPVGSDTDNFKFRAVATQLVL
tara:strand:- start:1081 stop:3906 length:2826 start_codon:yes stop_codon:yes gene_type:complete